MPKSQIQIALRSHVLFSHHSQRCCEAWRSVKLLS